MQKDKRNKIFFSPFFLTFAFTQNHDTGKRVADDTPVLSRRDMANVILF